MGQIGGSFFAWPFAGKPKRKTSWGFRVRFFETPTSQTPFGGAHLKHLKSLDPQPVPIDDFPLTKVSCARANPLVSSWLSKTPRYHSRPASEPPFDRGLCLGARPCRATCAARPHAPGVWGQLRAAWCHKKSCRLTWKNNRVSFFLSLAFAARAHTSLGHDVILLESGVSNP